MKIIGISAFYHDSAAALVIEGQIVAAAQEERFTRKKNDASFPKHSLQFCLQQAGLQISDIDEIVYYEKPFLSFERLLQSIIAKAPRSLFAFLSSMPIWMREKLNTRKTLQKHLRNSFKNQKIPPISFSQHHLSHAASAFFASPYESAAVLCLDGVGEWATSSAWLGQGNQIESLWEMHFPHSAGLLYSAFTFYCGFKVNSGEYKLMGLAPYGKPVYVDLIKTRLLDLKEDGSFKLNMRYFSFASSLSMTNQEFSQLFGFPPRTPEAPMREEYKNMAASIQKVIEEIMLRLARTLQIQTGSRQLCLAGGVALNCVANGVIAREKIFESIWIQPAAGDAGGALGAALASYYLRHKNTRLKIEDAMQGAFLGPHYTDSEIESLLHELKIPFQKLNSEEKLQKACQELQKQNVIGWFQQNMEFGPRALGARSILGDPRVADMQSRMNLKIKFRESFRPFAPVILQDRVKDLYQDDFHNPYMLLVSHVKPEYECSFPAVTHVDGSARLQTVSDKENPLMYKLLKLFEAQTGCPLLVNTSFNVRGEPIVCSPMDALRCFVLTDIDALFIGSYYLRKQDQSFDRADPQWKVAYELD